MSSESPSGWRSLDHTADEGLEVWAPAFEELLSVASTALFELMGEAPDGETVTARVEAEGIDREDLLVRLLQQLVVDFTLAGTYWVEVEDIAITGSTDSIHASLQGRAVIVDRHAPSDLVEIKAVTYHALSVEERDGVWHATVVFDF